MIKARAKKLWLGNVSIRSPLVDKAMMNHESILIQLGNDSMEVSHQDLLRKGKWSKQKFISKYDGQYFLVDYPWKPQNKQGVLI